MKKREPRVKVNVPARMRAGGEWADVCIQNMSSRGLMARSRTDLRAGLYVEIRRGSITIIGRIVWARAGLFGLRTQDRIDIPAVVREPRLRASPGSSQVSHAVERRAEGRRKAPQTVVQRAERSRTFARAFQFIAISGAGALGCFAVVAVVGRLLSDVSAKIQLALGG